MRLIAFPRTGGGGWEKTIFYPGDVSTVATERDAVLANVEKTLLGIQGVEAIRYLEPKLKEEIARLELLAEQNGACGGLMPFRNSGVWAALSREVSCMVVGNAHFIVHNEGLLYMMDTSGQVIGEYVPAHLKEQFVRDHPDANFLSDDFVLHPNVSVQGEPYFLIAEIDFPYLDKMDGITRLTSGSISTMSDDWVRSLMGCDGPNHWTHLVGFDILP